MMFHATCCRLVDSTTRPECFQEFALGLTSLEDCILQTDKLGATSDGVGVYPLKTGFEDAYKSSYEKFSSQHLTHLECSGCV